MINFQHEIISGIEIELTSVYYIFSFLFQFGKGIYFADMSSKSANYCFANQNNNVGLLLLCEVRVLFCLFVCLPLIIFIIKVLLQLPWPANFLNLLPRKCLVCSLQ